MRILRKLMRRRGGFDAVLIETTGLADPAPVLQTFFVDDELREAYSLDALITVGGRVSLRAVVSGVLCVCVCVCVCVHVCVSARRGVRGAGFRSRCPHN